ncbi:MAG: TAXI family TRAP transporter solute-binding subunit, partial [Burkholderiales bacterium]
VLTGAEPYADNGKVPLRALASLDNYLFVCREDLPQQSAHMLTEALEERWKDMASALPEQAKSPKPSESSRIPLHPGAVEYYREHD